ncbi:MAG: RIP metalloprotease RseP, partial [Alphaproteobacteria bacterium]|nr:RIP metalloprotease RseP [Alphaproteobacteria bacterium]
SLDSMSEGDKAVSFHFKPLWQRALIVAAGPLANFILAIILLAGLFMTDGQPYTAPVATAIIEDTPADEAGLQPGDRFLSIAGMSIDSFEEMQNIVSMSAGMPLQVEFERDGQLQETILTPAVVKITDNFGKEHEIGRIGVAGEQRATIRRGPVDAVHHAVLKTGDYVVLTLRVVWDIIRGVRGADELGGPIKIGQISGQVAQISLGVTVLFMAILSINLGLINLFPIPMLDGGHLLYYAFEAVRGKPLGERAQEYGFRFGVLAVLSLMVFVTWNDLNSLNVPQAVSSFVTNLF